MQRDEPADDAAWQAIVDNYGEPVLGADDIEVPPAPEPERARRPEPDEYDDGPDPTLDDPDDEFVPPAPPPLPRPTPDRLVAWLGVFVAPLLLLTFVITGFHPPRLLGWTLVLWFLGGFGYLVATMPSSPHDPWDDGAQV